MEEEKAPQIENPEKISIPDFKEYEIDRNGNVFRNGKLMKQQTNTYGYKHIHLCIGGKVTTCLVHRLVAMAFIPNPDGKPCVDHIDGNRKNNSVDNLRWVTIKENNNNPITKENVLDYLKVEKIVLFMGNVANVVYIQNLCFSLRTGN